MKIEKTFIVSLEERKADRLIPLLFKLHELGFEDYNVCTAIKRDNGAVGLLLTIKKLFEECIEIGYSNVLVFEDDVHFLRDDVRHYIEVCMEQLDEDFDCLYLGCNLWQNVNFLHNRNLIQLYDAYGLQSVIYSRQAMIKIVAALDYMVEIMPLDVLIQRKVMPQGKCFASFPNLTSQRVSFSDIENKIQDWNKVLVQRFTEKTKHLC
jgi:hypothetical protein